MELVKKTRRRRIYPGISHGEIKRLSDGERVAGFGTSVISALESFGFQGSAAGESHGSADRVDDWVGVEPHD